MPAQFDDGGIRFLFPENWRLEREDTGEGWTVSVQSADTAFMVISVNEEQRTPVELLETTLTALKSEYKDLEYDEIVETVAGLPAEGHDIRFTSLDLTNTCWTRAFYGAGGTVLVLCQCNDLESDLNEPVLRAMCKSLQVDD